ncbi:putative ammonium transporter 1 member 2-like [Capsicum annuum]|nr:putative ammonium transporter 1 member 2-like [Capsicum annuum]KAF3671955.1 putative ammonium transporter 1 member 2-like [Capsicum annuum]
MGSDVLQFLTCPSLHNPVSSPLLPRFPLNNSTRCSSTSSGCRGHSNSRRRKDYQGFSWDEEIRANDKGEDFGFGKRIWWSDEYDIEDEEDAGIDGFGTMDASIGFAWVIKIGDGDMEAAQETRPLTDDEELFKAHLAMEYENVTRNEEIFWRQNVTT